MAGKFATVNKPLAWFKGNPENYRSHPPEQQEVLQESIRRFGIFRNVVARPDGTILAGHGILAAAHAEGLTEFPCVVFDGTDEEARALMVADNEQARLAQDDPDQLSQLLDSLRADGLMQVTGHDDSSLAALLEEVAAQAPPTGFVPEEDPGPGEPPEDPVTRLGDVWCMGKLGHRLVCGDCTDALVVEKALAGNAPDVVFTDPPYGVKFHGSSVETRDIAGDDIGIENWLGFVSLVPHDVPLYVCCDFRSYPALFFALKGLKRPVAECVVWDKTGGKENVPVPRGALDRWIRSTEFVAYCGKLKEDFGHSANVLHIPRMYADEVLSEQDPHVAEWQDKLMELHPTIKPLALVSRCITAHSKAKSTFDPFVGSGTTLIASDQVNRTCFAIELDPRYCDVTVTRYQRMTNKPAILEATGETFDALRDRPRAG